MSVRSVARTALRVLFAAPIFIYQRLVSPMFPSSCLYVPSCSQYAIGAIMKHGVLRGLLLGTARVLRCAGGLFTGGEDPVPDHFGLDRIREDFRRFRRRRSS